MRVQRTHALIFLSLTVVGCTPTIVEYYSPRSPLIHVVQAGETLHSIAWQHGLDTRDLVRWYGLQNPDLILVGQRLNLRLGGPSGASTPPSAPRQPPPLPPQLPAPSWGWPVQGPLVTTYGSRSGTGQGIGIGGEIGQDIRAAAPGRVVYAGDGLVGYGQLLIIEHNDTYLSAYGHNDQLIVAEGDTVKQGQVIAAMGLGPGRQPQLHFEIRRNGAPVDPLGYLSR